MKGLTSKEEEIMNYFWHKGPLFVKELLDFYDEPKPHFNTLSTIVRGLEEKGYVSHKAYGKTYQYFAVVSEESLKNGPCDKSYVSTSTAPIWESFPL